MFRTVCLLRNTSFDGKLCLSDGKGSFYIALVPSRSTAQSSEGKNAAFL